jgi:hypothetical protein
MTFILTFLVDHFSPTFFLLLLCFAQHSLVNIINILRTNFSYEHCLGSFSLKKLSKRHLYAKFVRKMLMKLTPVVNFINNLRIAFTQADTKSAKKTVKSSVFFALLVSLPIKAAHKTLLKLNLGVNFINILCSHFLNESALAQLSLETFQLRNFRFQNIGAKFACKMLLKSTPERNLKFKKHIPLFSHTCLSSNFCLSYNVCAYKRGW